MSPNRNEELSRSDLDHDSTALESEENLDALAEDSSGDLMLKASGASAIAEGPDEAHSVLTAPGQPLDPATRQSMERRFRFDFGNVRVHTEDSAQRSASAVGAHAYTLGSHIVFGAEEYSPRSERGEHLLAHELAHTIQQQDSPHSRLQRAEFGTYVSTKGVQNYLDAGAKYYKDWGFPNVKRVGNVKEVLDDLDRSRGTIDKFRIVSHGNSAGLELGNVQGLKSQPTEGYDMKDWFTRQGAEFSNEARFRKHFIDAKYPTLVTETFFQRIIRELRKDARTMLPILTRLGADKDTPATDSPAGIVMRAMADRVYLGKVKRDDGSAPAFKNRAVLDQFINTRISTFQPVAVHSVAAAQQPDLDKAFGDFSASLGTGFDAAGLTFHAVDADLESTLADTYRDTTSRTPKLESDITTALGEGKEGGGEFVKKLKSVKSKIDGNTHIEIRGCNVGAEITTLDSFREFFGETGKLPSISAPDLFQYFFQLNFASFTRDPTDVTALEGAFNKSDTGVEKAFDDQRRMQAGEMMRVVNEKSLTELATKYSFKLTDLERWNPQITDPTKVTEGQEVWLVMRAIAPAGKHKTLKAFCKDYLGDDKALADVKTANAHLNPDALAETDQITVPRTWQAAQIAAPKPGVADFVAAIRAGETVTAVGTTNAPVTHMDDSKRAASLGAWLAKQQFDPLGRTAAQLTALYTGSKFTRQAAKTHLNFLSNGYPNIVDPIFPEDPRYAKHVIKRP